MHSRVENSAAAGKANKDIERRRMTDLEDLDMTNLHEVDAACREGKRAAAGHESPFEASEELLEHAPADGLDERSPPRCSTCRRSRRGAVPERPGGDPPPAPLLSCHRWEAADSSPEGEGLTRAGGGLRWPRPKLGRGEVRRPRPSSRPTRSPRGRRDHPAVSSRPCRQYLRSYSSCCTGRKCRACFPLLRYCT
jgi:hypothetical protein